jgi:hypothetical protein
MSKSLIYVEASGLKQTLDVFKVKKMQNIPLSEDEKIIEDFLINRIAKLEKELEK